MKNKKFMVQMLGIIYLFLNKKQVLHDLFKIINQFQQKIIIVFN